MKGNSYFSNYSQLKRKKSKKGYSRLIFFVLAFAAVAVLLKCSGVWGTGTEDEEETEQTKATVWEPSSLEEVIEVTPDNSPDNPKFIKVSFTEEEYKNSPIYSEKIFRDSLTVADFKEEGVQVSIDSYNLHNAEDEVKVQVLPKKKDPTYGNELYTYNISLTSGQHEFGTEVEVTLPIHNGKNALCNVLWHNPESGEWEEVYYTVAEDGKSCTAYVDHFSELSVEEISLDELKKMGKKLIEIYDNGSVFVEMNADVNSRAMLPVGIVPTPVFEKIARRQTETAKGLFEVLKNGGGLPMNAVLENTLDVFGFGLDGTSSALTLGQLLQLVGNGLGYDLTGGALTMIGGIVLAVRLLDEQKRGIDPVKSFDDNFWSYASLYLGVRGSLAAIAGLPGVATVCGCACMGIFICTTSAKVNQIMTDIISPFGTPWTIEEGAYHQYLRTPNTEVLKKLGIKSDVVLTGTGTGWSEAFKAIFKEKKGILHAKELGDKIIELYDTYIDYFWDELDPQSKRLFWRDYIDKACLEWGGFTEYKTNLPSEEGENDRLGKIIKDANMILLDHGHYLPSKMSDEAFATAWHEIKYDDNHIRASVKEYKRRALLAVAKHTNTIIAKLIEEEQHNNIMDAKRLLRDEVIPLMNTMLIFHAKDMQLKDKDPIDHSIYYGYNPKTQKPDHQLLSKWEFYGDKNPLFEANYYEGTYYCLWLKADANNDELGKSNLFHYLQYNAPDSVKITPAKDTKLGEITGYINFKDKQPYVVKGRHRSIKEKGFRVPIEFNKVNDLNQFTGFWIPLEFMGKYTPSQWVLGLSYIEEENKFGEFEGPGQNYAAKGRWIEIKNFDYNPKTGVLTIDFAKNDPKKGQGTATFYINKNDNLVMKNYGGTNEFFRATDENMKKNNELYQKEQERKTKERQKMQDEFKNYSIIPSGE